MIAIAASRSSTLLMEVCLLLEIPQATATRLTNIHSKKLRAPSLRSWRPEMSLMSCFMEVPSLTVSLSCARSEKELEYK